MNFKMQSGTYLTTFTTIYEKLKIKRNYRVGWFHIKLESLPVLISVQVVIAS